jgi:hypothetical protein
MQAQHFHAVLQRGWNGVNYVGGRDKKYLGEVVLDVEVMIHKHEILLGIEDFK